MTRKVAMPTTVVPSLLLIAATMSCPMPGMLKIASMITVPPSIPARLSPRYVDTGIIVLRRAWPQMRRSGLSPFAMAVRM